MYFVLGSQLFIMGRKRTAHVRRKQKAFVSPAPVEAEA